MPFAPQPSTAAAAWASPTASGAPQSSHPHQPPTMATQMPTVPPSDGGANRTGHTAQMTTSSLPNLGSGALSVPATAGTAAGGSSTGTAQVAGGQTAPSVPPPRPVIKRKRTGNQGLLPFSSSSGFLTTVKSSAVRPNMQNLQNTLQHQPKAAPSPHSFPLAAHARPSTDVNRLATSLSPSVPPSALPDRNPATFSRPETLHSRPTGHPLMDSTSRHAAPKSVGLDLGSDRESSPLSSKASSPEPPPDRPPQPEFVEHAPHRSASRSQISPPPFLRNSGRTASMADTPAKPSPLAKQSSQVTPGLPVKEGLAINPKTGMPYTGSDALDDASYRTYLEFDGQNTETNTRGALIPAKYKKSDDKDYPWICPVRSCRAKHLTLSGLGSHFGSSHGGKCLNDNLDSTLTILGDYKGDRVRSTVPIIVSKRHMTLDESPIAAPWRRERPGPRPLGTLNSKQKARHDNDQDDDFSSGSSEELDSALGKKKAVKRMANPDRLYTEWTEPGQSTKQMLPNNLILPDDYTKHTGMEDRSYICPIRSCRHLHKSITELSAHWIRVHSGYYLNDNLDGTFTVVESRKTKQYKPSVVISKTPNDSDPVVRPKYPRHTTGNNPVWVDLFDENTVIDHNTAISNDAPGSRIAEHGLQQSASAPKGLRTQGKKAPSPVIVEVASQEPDEHPESRLRMRIPRSVDEEVQGAQKPKKTSHHDVSEPTNSGLRPIHSDVGISHTKSGRPYASFIDPETGEVKAFTSDHVVIPDGYKLLTEEYPARPFVCPIRTCRRLIKDPHGMVHHFSYNHRQDAVNDNCDGTLSIVGRSRGNRCIVVAQTPLDQQNKPEPMVEPTFPKYSKPQLAREHLEAKNRASGKAAARSHIVDNSVLDTDDEFEDGDEAEDEPASDKLPTAKSGFPVEASAMVELGAPSVADDPQGSWAYLCAQLGRDYSLVAEGAIQVLLQLPPVRPLDLRRSLAGVSLDQNQLTAALIHVVGEEFPKAPCTQCRTKSHGPFRSCVRVHVSISEQLFPYLKSVRLACTNCLFDRRAHSCSVKYSGIRYNGGVGWTVPTSTAGTTRPVPKPPYAGRVPYGPDDEVPGTSSASEPGEDYSAARGLRKRRRPERFEMDLSVPDLEPEPKRTKVVTMRVQPDKLGATTTLGRTSATSLGAPARREAPASEARKWNAGGLSPGTTQDVLAMEDWEVDEGRISSANPHPSASDQNVATHVSIGESFQVDGVTFTLKVISSGGAFSFPVDPNQTRACFVHQGKLKVQVGNEKEFAIGQGGIFRISRGVKCLVVNTSYLDAMLHVTTWKGQGAPIQVGD